MGFRDLAPTPLDAAIPAMVAEARRELLPAQTPDTILEVIASIAERKGVDMPKGPMFDVEVAIMAEWPPDLFLKAFAEVVRTHVYPRVPTCAEFYALIRDELEERRTRLARLQSAEGKIRLRDRDRQQRAEAEWMATGKQPTTQADRDAVAAMMAKVRGHLTTLPEASHRSQQDDPRSDRDAEAEADRQAR